MDLELHQLDLRYEKLRKRNAKQERQVMCSLAETGQQLPIVVVAGGEAGCWIVIDGYKRVRAQRRLKQDTVRAIQWEVDETEALLLERMMRSRDVEGPLEQGWLLRELDQRFGLTREELSRRLDRSQSWVSRRLALVRELPETIQERVRVGQIMAHVAMKYLVPMARANAGAAERLAMAMAPLKLSTRQAHQLYEGWQRGNAQTKELIEKQPAIYLRALEEAERESPSASEQLRSELSALAGIARRVVKRLQQGWWQQLSSEEQAEAKRCGDQAQADAKRLFARIEQENARAQKQREKTDAGSKHESRGTAAA